MQGSFSCFLDLIVALFGAVMNVHLHRWAHRPLIPDGHAACCLAGTHHCLVVLTFVVSCPCALLSGVLSFCVTCVSFRFAQLARTRAKETLHQTAQACTAVRGIAENTVSTLEQPWAHLCTCAMYTMQPQHTWDELDDFSDVALVKSTTALFSSLGVGDRCCLAGAQYCAGFPLHR